jgi:hypothetical protein
MAAIEKNSKQVGRAGEIAAEAAIRAYSGYPHALQVSKPSNQN